MQPIQETTFVYVSDSHEPCGHVVKVTELDNNRHITDSRFWAYTNGECEGSYRTFDTARRKVLGTFHKLVKDDPFNFAHH